jgi:TetR/AcrR family transcriptional regulator
MAKSAAKRRPKRGKSGTGTPVREAILAAARRLFAENEFKAVTTKRIADAAGVTTAMIHYYFGEKAALFEAIIAEIVDPTFEQAQAQVKAGASFEEILANTWQIQERMLVAYPWLPALLVRATLSENKAMQKRFAEKFAQSRAAFLSAIIEQDKRAGRLRTDLDPFLMSISLVSLFQYPLLAAALKSKLFGVVLTPDLLRRLGSHNQRLILDGIRAQDGG